MLAIYAYNYTSRIYLPIKEKYNNLSYLKSMNINSTFQKVVCFITDTLKISELDKKISMLVPSMAFKIQTQELIPKKTENNHSEINSSVSVTAHNIASLEQSN